MRRSLPALLLSICLVLGSVSSPSGLATAIAKAADAPVAESLRNARAVDCTTTWEWLRGHVLGWFAPADDPMARLQREGGSLIVLKLDPDDLRRTMLQELLDDVRRLLREGRVGVSSAPAIRDGGIEVRLRDASDVERTMTRFAATSVQLGPAGGETVEVRSVDDSLIRLAPTQAALDDRARVAIEQAVESTKRRIQAAGIAGGDVRRDGPGRIRVILPSVKNPGSLLSLLGSSRARLTFHLAEASVPVNDASNIAASEDSEIMYAHQTKLPYLVSKRVIAGGQDIADADVACDRVTREPVATLRFGARATRNFAQATRDNVGRAIAVALDHEVISAPVIREPVLDGMSQISGGLTRGTARELATLLRAGMMPGRLLVVEQRVIEGSGPAVRQ